MSWTHFTFVMINIVSFGNSQKNILFLVADDMRPNLGVYEDSNSDIFKQPPMYTPNLDALASKSLLFEKAYDVLPLCSPSRTSTLTGRRPDTTKILRIGYYWRTYGGNFTTIPQFFKENGYTTIGTGKIFHSGRSSNNHDCKYSWSSCPFFEADDPYNSQRKYSWIAVPKNETDTIPLRDTANVNWLLPHLKEAAENYQSKGTPFFIGFGAHKPHTPWVFPEEFLEFYPEDTIETPDNPYCPVNMPESAWNNPGLFKYKDCSKETLGIPDLGEINVTLPEWKTKELRRAYYAAVSYSDHEIGRVLNYLETLGVADDTIIVFWGDHGWQLGEHAEWNKQNFFEITNRVPFMIRIPGLTDKGMKSSKAVELIDLFPTLVEAAGFDSLPFCPKSSSDIKLCTEGRSLLPLFLDPTTPNWDESVFWQYHRGGFVDDVVPRQMGYTIKVPGYRYTEYVKIEDLGNYEYRPLWDVPVDHEELYDLRIDPQENINRYDDQNYKTIKEELSTRLHLQYGKAGTS